MRRRPYGVALKKAAGTDRASGFRDICSAALKAATSGSINALPATCFVMVTALPRGSTRALPTASW